MSEDTRMTQPDVPTATSAPSDASAAASRVRSRLVRFGTRSSGVTPGLEPLMQALRTNYPKADFAAIEQAYAVAERAHRGQMRKSGDPFITHPVAVATILAELGMTTQTLVAALLHDTVEDTDYSLAELTEEFGP